MDQRGAPIDRLALLGALQDQFLETIPRVDPDAPVAACAPWRARDLVDHLARVHHWAAAKARRTPEQPLGAGPEGLVELYGRCAAELRATLAALDPAATADTLVGPGPVSFWHRRQLHETLVHLWDLRTAGGGDVEAAPAVWADAVAEVATMFQPRQVRLGRTPPLGRGVELVATDVDPGPDGRWLLGAHQDGSPVTSAVVTVTAPAKSLALLVWGRYAPDEAGVAIDGDRAALDEALASGRLTP